MLHKVSVNTEVVNTLLPLPPANSKLGVTFLRASAYIFINLSMHKFVFCVFLLKTPYLMHVVDLFSMTEQSLPNTQIFS